VALPQGPQVPFVLLSPQSLFDNKFDDIFGSSFSSDPFNFNSQNGMNKDDK